MTLKEFVKACMDNGMDMNDQIRIRSWASEYEIFYDNGAKRDYFYIDK